MTEFLKTKKKEAREEKKYMPGKEENIIKWKRARNTPYQFLFIFTLFPLAHLPFPC